MENGNYWSETQDRASHVAEGPGPDRGDPAAIGRYRVIRRLGQGGFGRVYLARDDDLDRSVAIKVPNPERIAGPGDVEAYLAEARALARLDHPHIVPVYDVGRTADGVCFVVSKYIDGSDLADRIARARPSPREAAELVATVAEALHHAHTRGLVHRDIKPANILIDAARSPWVADFGLALKDEDYGKGARLAGTPSYMSPEQARGEGHRVDGRSDLFSLGVVLYELLTGRKPFRGETRAEVMDQIATAEPRPLRQIDDTLARELERICLKALSKRASERYSTGRDLAEDLQHFIQTEAAPTAPPAPPPSAPSAVVPSPAPIAEPTPSAPVVTRSDSDGRAVKIVPKGLRSFDRHDAGFFLELLPGPRDRDGLPESLRFWKVRIESTDPDATFKVGLIYGPSGCGKSSMVKAGLLPRLHPDVRPVYVEATPEETEARLLRGLRKACPELDAGMDLVESMSALRRGRVLRPGQKVVLVLDQFEQWLFARRNEVKPELVAALRQCDGDHLQALAMVRDDFWMAATRFMRDLEVRIVEGENSAAVDLFDLLHARRVLAAFGRAYGVLPEKPSELSADQKAFLEQSVAGLAHEGKVISVRLALFAEMVKGKPWTTATLREVGGARGVGVTFLEETFAAATAPPEHRLHQRAAQAILKALLPGAGADIKGQMRSEAELRAASGYAARPRDFDDVIGILDRELRLITPTDPEGSADESFTGERDDDRFYQLTHDYLVPSLREWLTRKQRETRRGRAELRLAERAAIWEARPEARHLPSVAEWASIRALTRPKDWTEPQRRMMRRAGRSHGLRTIALAIGVIGLGLSGLEIWQRVASARRAAAEATRAVAEEKRQAAIRASLDRVQDLLKAPIAEVPALLREIAGDPTADAELARVLADPLVNEEARLHARLARLATDPSQVPHLHEHLLKARPDEVPVLVEGLEPHRDDLTPKLWPALESADARLLPVAAALARYAPDDPRWAGHAEKVARALAASEAGSLDAWLAMLRPIRGRLVDAMAAIFREGRPEAERALITRGLVAYAEDDPARLADLLMDADPKSYASLFAIAAKRPDAVAAVLRAELDRGPRSGWEDPAADPSWPAPDPATGRAIGAAHGQLADRLAFCQTMPLAEFEAVAESLRASRYRPIRFRPYADGRSTRVAAVWTRDGRRWRIRSDLTAEAARRLDEAHAAEKLIPVDVSGYAVAGDDGRPAERYAAIWAEPADGEEARMYLGLTEDEEADRRDAFEDRGLVPRTIQVRTASDGRHRISAVWGRSSSNEVPAEVALDRYEAEFAASPTRRADVVLMDASIGEAGPTRTAAGRAREALARAGKVLAADPENVEARRARAIAELRLDRPAEALEGLLAVRDARDDDAEGLPYRAIARARLGRKSEARLDLATLKAASVPARTKLSIEAAVAAMLGDDDEPAFRALEAAIAKDPGDPDLRHDAARAFALASRPAAGRDPAKGRRRADRALDLLKGLAEAGEADFGRMDDDPALDPVREDPRFAAIMGRARPDRRYSAIWSPRENRESATIAGCGPDEQLRRARKLISEGYRPVAWSAVRTTGAAPITASAWLRPMIPESERDRLARRQARAAVALIRIGRGAEVWTLLRHAPDPRFRGFLLNDLEPLGVPPGAVAGELGRLEANGRGRPVATERTEAALFDPEVSERRALILALGKYGTHGAEKDEWAEKLLRLYRNDPDAGIHGAAEWTLRRWGLRDRLAECDADLKGTGARGDRRWFLNAEGQAFAVIDGPREFRMGSPPTDVQRNRAAEPPERVAIPRQYAIATKEVTNEEFERFVKAHRKYKLDSDVKGLSAGPDGPRMGVTWYGAAAYCNWLSQLEGLPRDQWCYIPRDNGAYDDGMTIPENVLDRTGYRLPTEAEWEYACRAGAETSRHYGNADELLGEYACYGADRPQPCGLRLPNDLGLFDMLGNVYEWCNDRLQTTRPGRVRLFTDVVTTGEVVHDNRMRYFRGGSFNAPSELLRSSARSGELPSYLGSFVGFRPARTLKPSAPPPAAGP